MKTDQEIIQLMTRKQFDGVRYACAERLKQNPIDTQSWTFLGQAMIGLKRGRMAGLCFERALLCNPFALWEKQAMQDARAASSGRDDKLVLERLAIAEVPVTACVLTRNNAGTIRECLSALIPAVDEIIVVDTGSTDNTVSIIESLGLNVSSFKWTDDFSAVRNYALSLATHDWIFSVDSDEILYESDIRAVRTVASLFDDQVSLLFALQMNQNGQNVSPYPVPRLFKKRYFEWRRPIHEAPHLRDDAGVSMPSGLTVRIRLRHAGYDPNAVNLKSKIERNISLLKRSLDENPEDYTTLYYLGREYSINQQFDEAIRFLTLAYELGVQTSDAPLLPAVGSQLAYVYTLKNNLDAAIQTLERVTRDRPEHPDAWFSYGVLMHSTGRDIPKARDAILHSKQLAMTYMGTVPFDPEIARWKADEALKRWI